MRDLSADTGHTRFASRGGRAPRVLIAGAGVAALEALVGLRARLGPHVHLDLVAPGESFLYRPVSVAEAFNDTEPAELVA